MRQETANRRVAEVYMIDTLIAEKYMLTKTLQKFVTWFDANERNWSEEQRDATEFYNLRDIRDDARAVLMAVT